MTGGGTRYARFTWGTLWFTLFVVIWGGLVSASGAGDGCGDSWPLCGELLAESGAVSRFDTLIELTHRLTSGLALLAVVVMVVWSRRLFPGGHRARFWAAAGLVFMVIESLIGAALVIFSLVDMNVSLARALIQPVHMTNTYLLMGALGLAAWWAGSRRLRSADNEHAAARLVIGALIFVVTLSALGTTASLASTVFPSESFVEGVRADFTRDAHYLIRLRIWHPVLAVAFGGYLVWLGRRLSTNGDRPPSEFHVVTALYAVDLVVGALDAFLLAPIAIQLLHLLLAHAVWLGLLALWVRLVSEPGDPDGAAMAVG